MFAREQSLYCMCVSLVAWPWPWPMCASPGYVTIYVDDDVHVQPGRQCRFCRERMHNREVTHSLRKS